MQKYRNLRTLTLGFAVVVALILTGLFYHRWRAARTANYWVLHSHKVRNHIHIVAARVRDLQLGHHTFLITGDSESLEPYRIALGRNHIPGSRMPAESTALMDDVRILDSLTQDNERQQAHVDLLRALIISKILLTDSALRLQRDSGISSATAFVRGRHQQRLADSIRALVETMAREEDSILAQRHAAAEAHLNHNSFLLYGTVAFFYIAGLLALWQAGRSGNRRRIAEQELRVSNERLKTVIDGSDYAIFSSDSEGILRVFSRGAERMLGYKAEEEVGRPASESALKVMLPEEREARARKIMAQYGRPPQGLELFTLPLRDDGPSGQEWTYIRKDGSHLTVALNVFPLEGGGSVGIARDVTLIKDLERDLVESNALLKSLVDSTSYAILAADEGGRMTVINRAAELMLGRKASDFLGKPAADFMGLMIAPEDIRERAARLEVRYGRPIEGTEIFLKSLPGDTAHGIDLHFVRADGTRFPAVMSARPIEDASGNRVGVVAMASDVTTLRDLEKGLAQSNTLLNSVINSTDQAIIAVDMEGTLILYNPAAERMEGYPASEFLGRHTSYNTQKTMLREEIEARAAKIREEYGREPEEVEVFTLPLKDDSPGGVEWTFVKNGGMRYPVSMSVAPMRDVAGETIGYMAVIRDITARKALEASLRESRARLQAVIDGIDYAIFAADAGGVLRLINRGTERILGYSVSDMVGKPVTALAARFANPDELRARASRLAKHYGRMVTEMELIALPLPDDGPFGQEWTHSRPDGTSITLAFSVYTLQDDGGNPSGIVALARDITELKALERMKNEFVSTVSHELRTPLTSIRGALGLVAGGATGVLPEKAAELVAIAHRNSERLVRIINDILDVEKIESGKLSMNLEPVEAEPMLRQAIETHRAYGDKYKVRFVVKGVTPGLRVLADSDRLMQVLANLMSNAAKFSPPGSEIWLEAESLPASARFTVRDFGAGIPDAFRSRVFDKFAQAENTDTRRHDGTGLGLNITRKLVEGMNGSIGFETEEGKGTTFSFELPLAAVPVEAIDRGEGRGRILVCEDDRDVAALLRIMLERTGFIADTVYSLAEARVRLTQHQYAALTLDLMLPDGNGVDFLRELRSRGPDSPWAGLPVIVVSARAEEGRLELNGDAVGMIDWMVKPINEDALLRSLRRAMDATPGHMPRILHVEDDADLSHILGRALQGSAEWIGASSVREAEALLRSQHFDLMVLDLELPDGSGVRLLEELRELAGRPLPVLILSASETGEDLRLRVEAALVKSRMSEERIVETILALIHRPAETGKETT